MKENPNSKPIVKTIRDNVFVQCIVNGKTIKIPINEFITNVFTSSNSPYREYIAILNQSGTNAPVPIVLANTTGLTWTWSRSSSANYDVTASEEFGTNAIGISSPLQGYTTEFLSLDSQSFRLTINGGTDDLLTGSQHWVRITLV